MCAESEYGRGTRPAFAFNLYCGTQTSFFPGLPTLSLQTKSLSGQPWLWMSLCSEGGR